MELSPQETISIIDHPFMHIFAYLTLKNLDYKPFTASSVFYACKVQHKLIVTACCYCVRDMNSWYYCCSVGSWDCPTFQTTVDSYAQLYSSQWAKY